MKASYAQSFVDAPYWYRYNSLASYKGSSNLKPEYLSSIQLTPSVHLLDGKLTNTLNVYYNQLTDLIFRVPNATGDDPRYKNAGFLKSYGIENEISYLEKDYRIRANFTYQSAIDAENYEVTDSKVHNVPNIITNLISDFSTFSAFGKEVRINVTARYLSEQASPINAIKYGVSYINPENTVDAAFLLNFGLRIEDVFIKGFSLDSRVYNALNTEYYQGGSVKFPYPQASMWYFVRAGYKINLQ